MSVPHAPPPGLSAESVNGTFPFLAQVVPNMHRHGVAVCAIAIGPMVALSFAGPERGRDRPTFVPPPEADAPTRRRLLAAHMLGPVVDRAIVPDPPRDLNVAPHGFLLWFAARCHEHGIDRALVFCRTYDGRTDRDPAGRVLCESIYDRSFRFSCSITQGIDAFNSVVAAVLQLDDETAA